VPDEFAHDHAVSGSSADFDAPGETGSLLADRYELGDVLGRGGMAEVYRGFDRLLGREVAIKVLRDDAGDAAARARFDSEARTLARLSHSGLVTVLDAGFASRRPFLVMELVDGPSLAHVIARGPLDLESVGSVGLQIAQALAYAHGAGVVHRDVKPGNVLLGGDGRVKLADFGIARLVGETVRHTQTGMTIGTAAFLAPEQVQGQDVTGAADVYSLALVLLEAVTGERVFPGTPTEAALARLHRQPDIPDELPAMWRLLLARMTALDPAERATADQVAAELRTQYDGIIPMADSSPVGSSDPRGSGRLDATLLLSQTQPAQTRPAQGRAAGSGAPTVPSTPARAVQRARHASEAVRRGRPCGGGAPTQRRPTPEAWPPRSSACSPCLLSSLSLRATAPRPRTTRFRTTRPRSSVGH